MHAVCFATTIIMTTITTTTSKHSVNVNICVKRLHIQRNNITHRAVLGSRLYTASFAFDLETETQKFNESIDRIVKFIVKNAA